MNTPISSPARGYGNIYTPHAGSMIIQVQRELNLANRTIVLSARKVRMLRFLSSRNGWLIALLLLTSWVGLAVQAARIPLLTARLNRLEHTAQKLDSLQTTLSALQERYNRLHTLLGSSSPSSAAPATTPATAVAAPAAPVAQASAAMPAPALERGSIMPSATQPQDSTAQ
ncbi:MAG: hypothetical protein ACJ79S_19035 [Gemmatimonadaceae bacterium]